MDRKQHQHIYETTYTILAWMHEQAVNVWNTCREIKTDTQVPPQQEGSRDQRLGRHQ